jgi:hypothetical protein
MTSYRDVFCPTDLTAQSPSLPTRLLALKPITFNNNLQSKVPLQL